MVSPENIYTRNIQTEQAIFRNIYIYIYIYIYPYAQNKIQLKREHKFEREQELYMGRFGVRRIEKLYNYIIISKEKKKFKELGQLLILDRWE
jgi:hypothetical protein